MSTSDPAPVPKDSPSNSPADARVTSEAFDTGTIQLNVLRVSPADATTDAGSKKTPKIVILHGLRDTAWSLVPLARALTRQLGATIVLPELRGHGASDYPDGYAMPNFLMDVYAVLQHESADAPVGLIGHSLGGHISYKFSAIFPDMVKALMLVEGLGPPDRPRPTDPLKKAALYREMLLSRMLPSQRKPLTDIDDALTRLLRGNPRLDPDVAKGFIRNLVKETEGGLQWAFDGRASSVFLGNSSDDDADYWRAVQAPTCLISGTLSYEYWSSQFVNNSFTGHFAEGEMEARCAEFPNAQHHWFEQSGHMVHYDEPERLQALALRFFQEHL